MKVNYAGWRLNIFLIIGSLWILTGLFHLVEILFYDAEIRWLGLINILLGAVFLFYYIYMKKNGVLVIDDEKITLYSLPDKVIYFNNLEEVRYSVGDFRFKDLNNKEIVVAKESIAKNQHSEFEEKFLQIKEHIESKSKM